MGIYIPEKQDLVLREANSHYIRRQACSPAIVFGVCGLATHNEWWCREVRASPQARRTLEGEMRGQD